VQGVWASGALQGEDEEVSLVGFVLVGLLMASWGREQELSLFPALALVVEGTDGWSNTGWCNLRRGDERGRREAGLQD